MNRNAILERQQTRPNLIHSRKRQLLALKAFGNETAWLDGQLRWSDGKLVWQQGQLCFQPQASDIALAQRRLNQIAGRYYQLEAKRPLVEALPWLEKRKQHLEIAKFFQDFELPVLLNSGLLREGAIEAAQPQLLTRLLTLEVLCLDTLPISPAANLIRAGLPITDSLGHISEDPHAPLEARALVALILGAIQATHPEIWLLHSPQLYAEGWLCRAYKWGLRQSPLELTGAGLIITLLAQADGYELAQRCYQTLIQPNPFQLTPLAWREALIAGHAPCQVVEVAEALLEFKPIAKNILYLRDKLPYYCRHSQREEQAMVLRTQRAALLENLVELVRRFTQTTFDPQLLNLINSFCQNLLALKRDKVSLIKAILNVLQAGLKLAPSLHRPYLEILLKYQSKIWDVANVKSDPQEAEFKNWLINRQACYIEPIQALLAATGEAALVEKALNMDVLRAFIHYEWRDPALYRLIFKISNDFKISPTTNGLCWLIDRLATKTAIQSRLRPLLDRLMQLPPEKRVLLFKNFVLNQALTRGSVHQILASVTRHFECLLKFVDSCPAEPYMYDVLVKAIVVLDNEFATDPAKGEEWLEWSFAYLENVVKTKKDEVSFSCLHIELKLALTLAGGDLEAFQVCFPRLVEGDYDEQTEALERGNRALRNLPGLRDILRATLPTQIKRTIGIVARIGLMRPFGDNVLTSLSYLSTSPAVETLLSTAAEWQKLLELVPELSPAVSQYLHLQILRGRSANLPSGVERALQLPVKLATELQYLEQKLLAGNARADLLLRVNNLRERLNNRADLSQEMAREVRKSFAQVLVECQLRAAEHQLFECYRACLTKLVGPFHSDVPLDDDLLNAALLFFDISSNRRWLMRLIRNHLKGKSNWREELPANRAFLEELAAKGADVTAWLDSFPHTYKVPAIEGGKVCLHIETNPLRVLQMGNYFGTCLSFNGFNAFSTVTNACELNKRVLYATDSSGRVIGRKLIAISADGKLLGFRNYTALKDKAGNSALHAMFQRYCMAFAQQCKLELADDGKVKVLFSERWYDDGAWPWQPQN